MTCVDKTVPAELFEKEAMAWDSLQTRCKMPAGAPKEEASGRPKRRSDRKAKRPKAEKMNGRALKVAKLTNNQAGPNPAVGKVKATDGRIAADDKENVPAISSRAPRQMAILTTNRLTQKLHTGIYGQGKASGRILRRKALGDLKAPNIDSELQRILGGASLEEKSDAVDSKDPSPVGRRGLKCDSVSVNVSHQEPVTLSVETDLTDSMDDAPRTEDNEEEAILKSTANSIIASLEPEKMFQCAGYVDSLKNDLRKMLRNNNPQLYSELVAKFQQKRAAKSPKVYSHSPLGTPAVDNGMVAIASKPTIPTITVNAALPLTTSANGVSTPGALMDTSNNVKAGVDHSGLQPKASVLQDHPRGAENEGYPCSSVQSTEVSAPSAVYGCAGAGQLVQQGVMVAPSHIRADLSHVMLNSQSDPSLFGTVAAQEIFVGEELEPMGPHSSPPQTLFTTRQLSSHRHGNIHHGHVHNLSNNPGWDFLEIVDDHHVYHLPSRPQPPLVSQLSPPKMYPQKMF